MKICWVCNSIRHCHDTIMERLCNK